MTRDGDRERRPPQLDATDLLPLIAALVVVTLVALLMPTAATLAGSGRLPAARPAELIAGTVRLAAQQRWSDPASAYNETAARRMPDPGVWWTAAGGTLIALLVLAALAWAQLGPAIARERLGRRPYDPRGSRPRAWARPRDLHDLTSRRRTRGGFSLGTLDRRKLRSDPEGHVALIAPPRAGKTTRFVIPWLLEHDGPAIVTSTKRDVLDVTRNWRSRLGQVWVYDPFHHDTCTWDPLDGCADWSRALRQATWLADATQQGDSEIASYWRGEAAKLLAPLLHAAAITGQPISIVLGWLDTQNTEEPAQILAGTRAVAALRQLHGTAGLDERNRGTTYMSAGSVLAAYRYPELDKTTEPVLTTNAFLNGRANTLYLVAADRHQQLLTPLIATVLSALLHETAERTTRSGALSPTLRILMDEAANIAPLRELPRHLSQSAGHGIRIASVWQTIAQLEERYRAAGDTILANSTTKIFMGPITDEPTQRLLRNNLDGTTTRPRRHGESQRPNTTSAARQLERDRALVLAGNSSPAVTETRPWWKTPTIRRRAESPVRS